MFRRGAAIAAILPALALGAHPAAASSPGARLAVVKLNTRTGTELFTVDALGGESNTLYAAGPRQVPAVYPFESPAWSPDGTRLAFTAITGEVNGKHVSYPRTALGLVSEIGGAVEPVAGTAAGLAPVFSPEGGRIAFAKVRRRWRPNGEGGADLVYQSISIWLADLAGRASTQLTPWGNGLIQVPSSFSPDGSRLAFTRTVGDKPPEAMAMEFNGSADTVLARDALEPVYSPDGRQIAFLRGPMREKTRHSRAPGGSSTSVVWARFTDIYLRDSDGGGLRRLTRTRGAAELAPRWDPSGQRLAYTEARWFRSEAASYGFGDSIREVNADGTCPTEILSQRRSVFYGATWQPGPGRAAGPISC